MRLDLSSLLGYFCLFCLSIAQSPSVAELYTANNESSTCSRRTSVWAVYTSGSSTYFVQDGSYMGQASTSSPTETSVCGISTVWQTDYTSTIYSSRTSTLYVSDLFTMAGQSSTRVENAASAECPMPTTITITEPAPSTGSLQPSSSATSFRSDESLVENSRTVTVTSFLPATPLSAASTSSAVSRDNFTTTIYTKDTTCSLNFTSLVTSWNNLTTTVYTYNVSAPYDFVATISGTRYTTIYEPDVTVTISGSTITASATDALGNDDNDDNIDEQGSSTLTSNIPAATTTPVPTVVANLGFGNGTQNPLNSTKSDPSIIAQIATSDDSTPLTAYTGQSYLFLTFNDGTVPTSQLHRRQSTGQPLVYNATQSFSTIAGTEYHLSAAAIMGQNGDSAPSCTINICATNSDCSGPLPLTTSYAEYSYDYLAQVSANYTVATFSITCLGPAYVGLDEVSITAISSRNADASTPSSSSVVPDSTIASGTSTVSGTLNSPSGQSVRTVTQTIARTLTATATYSTVYYYTATQYVTSKEAQSSYFTSQLVPTTVVETATAYQNLTFTRTTTVTETAITSQISTAYVTEVQTTSRPPGTETTLVPYSTFIYETLVSTVYPNASTVTSVETRLSTIYSTLVQTTSQTVTVQEIISASGSTITQYMTSISLQPTTVVQTSISTLYITATSLQPYNVTYVSSYYSTLNLTQTLPQATATETAISLVVCTQLVPTTVTTEVLRTSTYSTQIPGPTSIIYSTYEVTYTTISTYLSTSIRNETQYQTILSSLPASTILQITTAPGPTSYQTVTLTSILPASTVITTQLSISSAAGVTSTYVSTYFTTLPASTYTYISILISTEPRTITETSYPPPTTLPGPTSYQTLTITTTLPASTILTTRVVTSSAPGTTAISTFLTTYYVTLPASSYTYTTVVVSTSISYAATPQTPPTPSPQTVTSVSYAPTPATPSPQHITVTGTQPASTVLTTQTVVSSAPGTTAVSTYLSTYYVTLPASSYTYTTVLVSTQYAATPATPATPQTPPTPFPQTVSSVSYAPTPATPSPQYITVTTTQPASTILTTQTVVSSAPGTTAILTYVTTFYTTLPASSYTYTTVLVSTQYTATPATPPAQTQTSTSITYAPTPATPPAQTYTQYAATPATPATPPAQTYTQYAATPATPSPQTQTIYTTVFSTSYAATPSPQTIYSTVTTTSYAPTPVPQTTTVYPATPSPQTTVLYSTVTAPAQTVSTTSTTTLTSTVTSTASPVPVRADGRCGPGFGNAPCDQYSYNPCCSQYGYCGNSTSHCAVSQGCVSGCTNYVPTNTRWVNTNRTTIAGPYPAGTTSDGVPIYNVPVPITMCGLTTSRVQMSVNGIFAVAGLDGINGNAWDKTHLPVTNSKVLIAGVFAYWDDLVINGGGNFTQGLFYTVSESSTPGARNISIEWYSNRYGDATKVYRFTLTFFENRPNTFALQYLRSDEQGTGATIGFQCDNSGNPGTYYEYSYNAATVPAGTQLTFNNNTASPVFVSSQFTTTYVQRVGRRLKTIRSLMPVLRSLWHSIKKRWNINPRKTTELARVETMSSDPHVKMEIAANGSTVWRIDSSRDS